MGEYKSYSINPLSLDCSFVEERFLMEPGKVATIEEIDTVTSSWMNDGIVYPVLQFLREALVANGKGHQIMEIIGPHGSGRTEMVFRLFREINNFFENLDSIYGFEPERNLIEPLRWNLEDYGSVEEAIGSFTEEINSRVEEFYPDIEFQEDVSVYEQLEKEDVFVIIVDDPLFFGRDDFIKIEKFFKRILENSEGTVLLVPIHGSVPLFKDNDLRLISKRFALQPFDIQGTSQLLEINDMNFDEKTIEEIFRLSGGIPWLIIKIGNLYCFEDQYDDSRKKEKLNSILRDNLLRDVPQELIESVIQLAFFDPDLLMKIFDYGFVTQESPDRKKIVLELSETMKKILFDYNLARYDEGISFFLPGVVDTIVSIVKETSSEGYKELIVFRDRIKSMIEEEIKKEYEIL